MLLSFIKGYHIHTETSVLPLTRKTFADEIDQNINFVKLASAKWMITPMAIKIKILGAISIAMGAKLWFILVFLKKNVTLQKFLKRTIVIFAPHNLKELSVNSFRQLNCNYKLVAYKSLQKLFCIHSQVKKKEENGHAGGKCVLIFYCCRRYAVRVA